MFKRYIWFIFLPGICCAFTGCNSEKGIKSDSAVIEGNIQYPSGKKIYFYSYPDTISLYLGTKVATDSSYIDDKGNYSISIHNNVPVIFNLESDNNVIVPNLYLIPGSRLRINFTGVKNNPEILSDGPVSDCNKFLIQFLDSFYRDSAVYYEYYIATNYMDIHEFTSYNEKRKHKQLDFFYNFYRNDSMNEEFRNYALNTINYGIAVDRLMYLWKKRMKSENQFGDSSFFSFETPEFTENINAFNCPAYIRFLNLYIKDIYERMAEKGELPRNKSEKLIPPVEKYKLASEILNSKFRNVVLFNIIHDDIYENYKTYQVEKISNNSLDSMITWFCRKYSI